MTHWLARLATHYTTMRCRYPDDELMVIFDIDGTLLDLRHMMLYLLRRYDREHGTAYFRELTLDAIDVHENVIDEFLTRLGLPAAARAEVEAWYLARYWSSETIASSHYAFDGVMDVIRWFQLQPQTTVCLNTGRQEVLRAATLESLNRLGQTQGVRFTNDLLYMRPDDWEEGVAAYKLVGLEDCRRRGYRVVAFVDNEPNNLATIAAADPDREILLLHADTIFLSPLTLLPEGVAQGDRYALDALVTQAMLPPALELVWHGVNDEINLRQFLSSTIRWAELDVNLDPTGEQLILRHDTFAERPCTEGESWLRLSDAVAALAKWDKALKLDFKIGGLWIEQALTQVEHYAFPAERLWFNGDLRILDKSWQRTLAARYPGAVIQAPVGFLRQWVDQPERLRTEVARLADDGLNRFSLNWRQAETRRLSEQLLAWGYQVNL